MTGMGSQCLIVSCGRKQPRHFLRHCEPNGATYADTYTGEAIQ